VEKDGEFGPLFAYRGEVMSLDGVRGIKESYNFEAHDLKLVPEAKKPPPRKEVEARQKKPCSKKGHPVKATSSGISEPPAPVTLGFTEQQLHESRRLQQSSVLESDALAASGAASNFVPDVQAKRISLAPVVAGTPPPALPVPPFAPLRGDPAASAIQVLLFLMTCNE
jgi:hypothetical protein